MSQLNISYLIHVYLSVKETLAHEQYELSLLNDVAKLNLELTKCLKQLKNNLLFKTCFCIIEKVPTL